MTHAGAYWPLPRALARGRAKPHFRLPCRPTPVTLGPVMRKNPDPTSALNAVAGAAPLPGVPQNRSAARGSSGSGVPLPKMLPEWS